MTNKELTKLVDPHFKEIKSKYEEIERILKANAQKIDTQTLIEALKKIEDFKIEAIHFDAIFNNLPF